MFVPIPLGVRYLVEKDGGLFEFEIEAMAMPDFAFVYTYYDNGSRIEGKWMRKEELADLLNGGVVHQVFTKGSFSPGSGAHPFHEEVGYEDERV